MEKAVSCGGVVIYRKKILLLYKNYRNRYEGWVLPKGTVEKGENHRETAIREVREETGVTGKIIDYIDKSEYSFNTPSGIVNKEVYWYLMTADSYYSKPQREEFFYDSGYYKYIESAEILHLSECRKKLPHKYRKIFLKKCAKPLTNEYCAL